MSVKNISSEDVVLSDFILHLGDYISRLQLYILHVLINSSYDYVSNYSLMSISTLWIENSFNKRFIYILFYYFFGGVRGEEG